MSYAARVIASLVVIVLAVPGLVVEPGPFSEIAAGLALVAIWSGDDPKEAVRSAA